MTVLAAAAKVTSERQILPVEVLVIIGQFLAGELQLETLANLNATGKSIQRETQAILYESLFLQVFEKGCTGTVRRIRSFRCPLEVEVLFLMIEGAPEEFKLDELIAPLSTASTVSRVADAVQRLRSDKTRMSNSASQSAAPVVKSIMPALRFAIVKHHDKVATSADPVIPYDLYLYDRVTLDHLYLILPKVKVGWCLTQGIRDIVLEQGGSLTAADTSVPGGQRGPYHGLVVYDLLCMRLPLSTKAPDRQLEEELHHRVAETVACYLWLLEGWSGYASTYLRHNHTIRVKGSYTHLPCLMALSGSIPPSYRIDLAVSELKLKPADVHRHWITGVTRYLQGRREYLQQNRDEDEFELNSSTNMTVDRGRGILLSTGAGPHVFGVSIFRPAARFRLLSRWPKRRVVQIDRALSQQPLTNEDDEIHVQDEQVWHADPEQWAHFERYSAVIHIEPTNMPPAPMADRR